jgi:CO/xanthine dehydrogenase Mo-binding subunit
MGEPAERFHIVGRDCGGGFGMKNGPYREYIVALWAASIRD